MESELVSPQESDVRGHQRGVAKKERSIRVVRGLLAVTGSLIHGGVGNALNGLSPTELCGQVCAGWLDNWSDRVVFARMVCNTKLMEVVKTSGLLLVPRVGVEPTRPYGQRILSPFDGILPDLT